MARPIPYYNRQHLRSAERRAEAAFSQALEYSDLPELLEELRAAVRERGGK